MAVTPAAPFADPEELLIVHLGPRTGVACDVSTPDPDEFTGEAIRVGRTGGSDDRRSDFPRLEVACFAQSYDRAVALGEQCRQLVLMLAGEAVALPGTPHHPAWFVTVDSARTDTPPERVPYINPRLTHDVAYYRLKLPRPRELTAARHAAALNPSA